MAFDSGHFRYFVVWNYKTDYMGCVTKEIWKERMSNLMNKRASGAYNNGNADAVYGLIRKGFIGKSVLDVGCGGMSIKNYLPEGTKYTGIDAFPINDQVIQMEAEKLWFEDQSFETVYAFAVLDGVQDLGKVISEMKRVCSKNIVILTGVDIEPDQYHTIKIKEAELHTMMEGFELTLRYEVRANVLLKEYTRK